MILSAKATVVVLLALVVNVCGQDELDLTPYNDAQMSASYFPCHRSSLSRLQFHY